MKKSPALAALSALANETRLDIVRLLVRAGEAGLPAGAIARKVRAPASRLSFHLTTLERARLIRARRDGRFLYYSARYDQLGALMGYLLSDCCKAHPEICRCLPESCTHSSGGGTANT